MKEGIILLSIYINILKIREWTLPTIELAKSQNTFNWCDNEYYSCC